MGQKSSLKPFLESNFPLEYRAVLVADMFKYIRQKESFSLIGMKDNNKKNTLRFIGLRTDVQANYLGTEAAKYKFIYIDANELPSLNMMNLYQLLGLKFAEAFGTKVRFAREPIKLFGQVQRLISEYTKAREEVLVVLFNNFEDVAAIENGRVFANLTALREFARYHLVYVLTGTRPFAGDYFFTNKIIWAPVFARADALGVIARNAVRYAEKLSNKTINHILKFSGGHPGLIKFCVQNYRQLDFADPSEWLGVADIVTQCRRIISVLTPGEIDDLRNGHANELLVRLGLQVKKGKKWEVFSSVLGEYLNSLRFEILPFIINAQTGEVTIRGKKAAELLSPQEEALLTLLLAQKGNLVTREMIVEYVWDQELPSDWSIDRLVARLRKKLGDSAKKPLLIKTVRGKGLILQIE